MYCTSTSQAALDYIHENPSVNEVILSGGDPLLLKDHVLFNFVKMLDAIPHLKTLRIHTRLPIVIPDRVTQGLVCLLEASRLSVVVVLHSNHANELDANVEAAVAKLKPFVLLNQAVLLNGVNDSAAALVALSQRLFDLNILPYYLHLLDPVTGTAHFDVSEATAKALIEKISTRLPGYLVPRLVREVAGMPSKQAIF